MEKHETLDFRKQPVTDLRDNPNVYLPKPRPNNEEKLLQMQHNMWETQIDNYADKHLNSKEKQFEQNIIKQKQLCMYVYLKENTHEY